MDNNNLFSTTVFYVAIGIHAANQLKFKGCRKSGNGQVLFDFFDPNHQGEELSLAFDQGKLVAPVNVTLASQRYLRRKMNEVLGVTR